MKPSPADRAQGIGMKLAPTILTLLLALLSAVPLGIPGYASVAPNLVLISVYHWTLYRPEYLSYLAVFGIGLFLDLLTTGPGTAVGLSPLVLLVSRWAVLSSRRSFVGRGFPFVWAGFAGVAALATLALWALGGLLDGHVLEPRSFLFEAALTIGLYPVATLLFARIQRVAAAAG